MITSSAYKKIRQFNKIGLHYNLVADSVYKLRKALNDPFTLEYLPYIIAGLVSFDMGRMMGPNAEGRYNPKVEGFAKTLWRKLKIIKPMMEGLTNIQINKLDISLHQKGIKEAYETLSVSGKDGLHQVGAGFHVGATKILHFINPEVFIIVDSNAARAFNHHHQIGYRKSTQPGYSAERYIVAIEKARQDILSYGISRFRNLDRGVPIARIYDKLTYIAGSNLLNK